MQSSLGRWRAGRGGGGDLPKVLKTEEARLSQLGSPDPLPRIWPAALTFILNLGDYRAGGLIALSLSASCSTLALPYAGCVTLGK